MAKLNNILKDQLISHGNIINNCNKCPKIENFTVIQSNFKGEMQFRVISSLKLRFFSDKIDRFKNYTCKN